MKRTHVSDVAGSVHVAHFYSLGAGGDDDVSEREGGGEDEGYAGDENFGLGRRASLVGISTGSQRSKQEIPRRARGRDEEFELADARVGAIELRDEKRRRLCLEVFGGDLDGSRSRRLRPR